MPQLPLLIWASLAVLHALFLILVWGLGPRRFFKPRRPAAPLNAHPPASLIIPLTGRTPGMEAALDSFLRQDYPSLETLLVTRGADDPAHGLAREICLRHAGLRHVTTGPAARCAQKNHNLLAGVAAANRRSQLYVFCDANHIARPSLVRELLEPILRGAAEFTTGYREIALEAYAPNGVALHLILWSLGQFQAMPIFTQPWGGAMAMSAAAFERQGVSKLWSRTVVDDCSLAGLLAGRGVKVRYCPAAILRTPVAAMDFQALLDWFTRQLLYPKFYTRAAWRLFGLGLISALALFLASLGLLSAGLTGAGATPVAAAAAAGHLLLPFALGALLRRRICASCPAKVWWRGFGVTLAVLYRAYFRSLVTRRVSWRGVGYEVNSGGKVVRIDREISHPPAARGTKVKTRVEPPGDRSDGG